MENNEQNKVVEPVSETTNTIMVSEPNNVETPVVEAPVVETPTEEPTQSVTPQPVVIPKGEKPKINKKKPNPILIILALILLAGACYFEYVYYILPIMESNDSQEVNTNKKDLPEEKGSETLPIDNITIEEKLSVKNKKIVSENGHNKDYTYDIYLGDKLVVGNLEYHESEGYNSNGKISLYTKGYLNDTVTDAKYFAFTVQVAPTKYATQKLFIIDKNGNIVFQRESQAEDATLIKETGELVKKTTYKFDEATNTMYYYDMPNGTGWAGMVVYVKAVQISSGKSVVTDYKTYNNDADTNENNIQEEKGGETLSIDDESIGKNLTIRNINYTTAVDTNFTDPFGTHTFDIYMDDKLLVKDFVNNEGPSRTEYKGNFLNKVGVLKDTNTDEKYFAFSAGAPLKNTLYIIDKEGEILFQKDGSKAANTLGFILKETNERFRTGDYKYVSELDSNTNKNVDLILIPTADYSKNEGIIKSVKISSGKVIESIYKTYTSAEVSLTGR